jgi:hypothetical protein
MAEDAAFVAPSIGVPPAQKWLQQCKLAAEHVAAGSFETAMRMLNRCNFFRFTPHRGAAEIFPRLASASLSSAKLEVVLMT